MHPLAWAAISTAGILAAEHYGLSRLLSRPLPNVVNYTIGVVAVIGPLSIALVELGLTAAVLPLWLAFASGGGAVVLFYVIDQIAEDQRRRRELEQENALLKKQRDEAGE